MRTFFFICKLALLFIVAIEAQAGVEFKIPRNAAKDLPRGVPRTVDTNGDVIFIDKKFTTKAYQEEALRLVIAEANKAAIEANLPESIPIVSSNLTHAFIGPFGFNYQLQSIGNITTSNYWYFVSQGNKLSAITIADIDGRCKIYVEKCQLPIDKINTKLPYELAIQWLAKLQMDVEGLNRDFDVDVAVDGYWNNVKMGDLPKRKFTPIYIVSWLTKGKPRYTAGGGASVGLFLPTKTLLDLRVDDSKYKLRPPLVFTNLAALFPGTAKVTTNTHSKPIFIDASKMFSPNSRKE